MGGVSHIKEILAVLTIEADMPYSHNDITHTCIYLGRTSAGFDSPFQLTFLPSPRLTCSIDELQQRFSSQ